MKKIENRGAISFAYWYLMCSYRSDHVGNWIGIWVTIYPVPPCVHGPKKTHHRFNVIVVCSPVLASIENLRECLEELECSLVLRVYSAKREMNFLHEDLEFNDQCF